MIQNMLILIFQIIIEIQTNKIFLQVFCYLADSWGYIHKILGRLRIPVKFILLLEKDSWPKNQRMRF